MSHLLWMSCALAMALVFAAPSAADAPAAIPIRVGAALDDSTTTLLYADHAGLFERAGLDVHIEKLNSGSMVASAVGGGALEVGKASTISLVLAYVRGLPFKAIAPLASYDGDDPDAGIVVAAGSPIHTARDFAGKILGVASLQDVNMLATESWIDQNGGDARAVKFVEIPPPAIPQALAAGRIDGAPVNEPMLAFARASDKFRVVGYQNDGVAKRYQSAVLFARTDWIAEHRDLVERFVRVVRDANAYAGTHEDEIAPLLAQFVGVDQSALSKVHHPGRPLYLDPARLQPVIDLAARYHVIAKNFPAADLISAAALKPGR
jgi:NitT/TauT family transport system substrate-binding protein